MDNRIAKHIYTDNAFTLLEKSTYYVRDASGNVMAVYDRIIDASVETGEFMLSERHIYGSSRIGMDVSTHVFGPDPYTALTETTRELGHKQYEISNHLGNVLSVITDQKLPVEVGSLIVSYSAVVVTATDYSPFGVGLYGRSWSGEYRYGFQGQEKDDEVKGEGNSINYKYRMHDPRIGRFLNVDPLTKKYPHWSPYSFSGNQVIHTSELEGLEPVSDANEYAKQIEDRSGKKPQSNTSTTAFEKLTTFNGNLPPSTVSPRTTDKPAKEATQNPQDNSSSAKGFGLYKPEITANLSAYAGGAGDSNQIGVEFNAGGAVVVGAKDNTLYVAGNNTETGNREVFESYGLSSPFAGFSYEKAMLGERKGPVLYEKANVSLFGFLYIEQTKFPDGITASDIGLQVGGKIGVGLVIDAGVQFPLYKE